MSGIYIGVSRLPGVHVWAKMASGIVRSIGRHPSG
jgi:hypothetical protein